MRRMGWNTEEEKKKAAESQEGCGPQEEGRARLELSRWFFLMGLLLAAALRVFFTVSLLWGLVIFEGIAALAAVILKIVDNKT